MYNAPGVGLAAPQIGDNIRVIVVDVSTKEEDNDLMELINPVIIRINQVLQSSEEGCLSIPGLLREHNQKKNVLWLKH